MYLEVDESCSCSTSGTNDMHVQMMAKQRLHLHVQSVMHYNNSWPGEVHVQCHVSTQYMIVSVEG